jgi:hypothetical protein
MLYFILKKAPSLPRRWLLVAVVYGIVFMLVMNYVVAPLSRAGRPIYPVETLPITRVSVAHRCWWGGSRQAWFRPRGALKLPGVGADPSAPPLDAGSRSSALKTRSGWLGSEAGCRTFLEQMRLDGTLRARIASIMRRLFFDRNASSSIAWIDEDGGVARSTCNSAERRSMRRFRMAARRATAGATIRG